ncbi:rhodanese-like domain-containing protein [Pleurocapsa sp. CCALA 161]|uniref:rhodanese-like domain-containing protein n=1 Tax=Pleurocapsa sp. CCALA 161 TaxID=2107688 RepID=UPI000D0501BB|nr:rhodanese-like domain-containing protein [Pleurocapsa sp. CCALA 161]PSB11282.1 rhodanese-like domain-containing protein [Pleurocapsa sp. CCALA 161]
MRKILATLLIAFWLYFGTFLRTNSTLADVTTSQTADGLETVAPKNYVAQLASKNLAPKTVQEFLSDLPSDYYTVQKIDALKTLTKEKQALLVDIRQPKEYAHGHIKGAINLPLRDITQNLDQIPKDRPVVLYCATGYRTAMGVMALQMLEYDNVRGFPPSIEGWKAAGENLDS